MVHWVGKTWQEPGEVTAVRDCAYNVIMEYDTIYTHKYKNDVSSRCVHVVWGCASTVWWMCGLALLNMTILVWKLGYQIHTQPCLGLFGPQINLLMACVYNTLESLGVHPFLSQFYRRAPASIWVHFALLKAQRELLVFRDGLMWLRIAVFCWTDPWMFTNWTCWLGPPSQLGTRPLMVYPQILRKLAEWKMVTAVANTLHFQRFHRSPFSHEIAAWELQRSPCPWNPAESPERPHWKQWP